MVIAGAQLIVPAMFGLVSRALGYRRLVEGWGTSRHRLHIVPLYRRDQVGERLLIEASRLKPSRHSRIGMKRFTRLPGDRELRDHMPVVHRLLPLQQGSLPPDIHLTPIGEGDRQGHLIPSGIIAYQMVLVV